MLYSNQITMKVFPNLLKISVILIAVIFSSSFCRTRSFPEFQLTDYGGQEISNAYFKNKKTIVIMGHLECPAMMYALKDYEAFSQQDESGIQILAILENTKDHIDQFYGDSSTFRGLFRAIFKIDSLNFPIITECETEKVKYKNGVLQVKNHCRKLSRKIRTRTTPTILLVDEEGKILLKEKGHLIYEEENGLKNWIYENFEI